MAKKKTETAKAVETTQTEQIETVEAQSSKIVMVSTSLLYHHPKNPRKDLGDVTELAESMKKNGVMQNLTILPSVGKEKDYNPEVDVQPFEENPNDDHHQYYVLIGNRRLEAARQAGIEELPCRIVTRLPFRKQLGIMLEENMQRNDLTIYEQAQGFQLMLDLGETIDTIKEKTGFGKTTIQHRLNIAKLNPKVLRDREKDEAFQLTLTDLYELEKIQNIKTRDKVLKEATDSRDLVRRALQEVRAETRAKNAKALMALLDARNITEKPDAKYDYGTKYDTIKNISLDEDPPKRLRLDGTSDGDVLYWCESYGGIKIVREKKKVKAEKQAVSPEEQARKEQEKRNKQLKAMAKNMISEILAFVKDIIDGKVEPLKPEDSLPGIWRAILKMDGYVSQGAALGYICGKDKWTLSDEEKKTALELFEALPLDQQMLLMFSDGLRNVDMVDWYGYPKEESVEKIAAVEAALKPFGFGWSGEELEQVAKGTHELYLQKTENDYDPDSCDECKYNNGTACTWPGKTKGYCIDGEHYEDKDEDPDEDLQDEE